MDPKIFSQILNTAGKILSNAPIPAGKNGQSLNMGKLIQGQLGAKSEALPYALNAAFLEPKAFEDALQKLHKEVFTHSDITKKLGNQNRELTLEKTKSNFVVTNSTNSSITASNDSHLGVLLSKEYLMRAIQNIKTNALSSGEEKAYQKLFETETYNMSSTWKITLNA